MQKAQVFLTTEQKASLKALAAKTGRKQSEIIRRGVDLALAESESQHGHWKVSLRKAGGLWKDRDDVEDVIAENRTKWRKRQAKTASRAPE